MKKRALIFVLMIVLLGAGWWHYKATLAPSYTDRMAMVRIADRDISAVVADTVAKREQGLSGRRKLAHGEGMLFVFEKPGIYNFWMKDMLFAIDIIWIDETGKVVYIQKDADPVSYPATFASVLPATYVLEVSAGFAEKNNLKTGDKVFLNL